MNPANLVPPGEHIREEIEARGWTQADFAQILGRPLKVVNEIINGKRIITVDTAEELAQAFGTSAQVWLNLEAAYRHGIRHGTPGSDTPIKKRSGLFALAPIGEMIRRGWLAESRDPEVIESEILRFFGIESIDQPLPLPVPLAARTGRAPTLEFRPPQKAWLHRVVKVANAVSAARFDPDSFRENLPSLRELVTFPDRVREVPRRLADLGVKFVVVEHLKGTKFDGACLWSSVAQPIVALSMRYDRLDWFWHTLMHELAHVLFEDRISLDEEIEGASVAQLDFERNADEYASNYLIPSEELHDFALRAGRTPSREKIIGFASRVGVHPAIVVGQLQHRKVIEYSIHRKFLDKVRAIILQSALVDGWGRPLGV